MSGPYTIQQHYFGDPRWWVVLGPTLKPVDDKDCLTFTANAKGMLEAEFLLQNLNAAFAAGQEAARKRIVTWLRVSGGSGPFFADELEKGGGG